LMALETVATEQPRSSAMSRNLVGWIKARGNRGGRSPRRRRWSGGPCGSGEFRPSGNRPTDHLVGQGAEFSDSSAERSEFRFRVEGIGQGHFQHSRRKYFVDRLRKRFISGVTVVRNSFGRRLSPIRKIPI
jgi:hypothetical protein